MRLARGGRESHQILGSISQRRGQELFGRLDSGLPVYLDHLSALQASSTMLGLSGPAQAHSDLVLRVKMIMIIILRVYGPLLPTRHTKPALQKKKR